MKNSLNCTEFRHYPEIEAISVHYPEIEAISVHYPEIEYGDCESPDCYTTISTLDTEILYSNPEITNPEIGWSGDSN